MHLQSMYLFRVLESDVMHFFLGYKKVKLIQVYDLKINDIKNSFRVSQFLLMPFSSLICLCHLPAETNQTKQFTIRQNKHTIPIRCVCNFGILYLLSLIKEFKFCF